MNAISTRLLIPRRTIVGDTPNISIMNKGITTYKDTIMSNISKMSRDITMNNISRDSATSNIITRNRDRISSPNDLNKTIIIHTRRTFRINRYTCSILTANRIAWK